MLAGGVRPGPTTVRTAALLIAAVLVVPACLALLRPHRVSGRPDAAAPRRRIDLLWAAVPLVLVAVLAAFSVSA
jgi:heme/copper-type cytochrome/quinol oxidase subunit 2